MSSTRFPFAALLSLACVAAPIDAHAQAQDTKVKRVVSFLAGGATGLIVHEAGHLASGLLLDANPGFKRLDYGVIPFFAVTHDQVSRRREFLISSSGFHAQHLASEWLLWRGPSGPAESQRALRNRSAAFKKGWLTFNLATSAVYTAAAFGRLGPPERDTRGMAISVGDDGVPEPVIGVLILAPAVLDGIRYLEDDPAWARWSSRALKAGLLLLALR